MMRFYRYEMINSGFISPFNVSIFRFDLAGFGDAQCDQDGGQNKVDNAGFVSSELDDGVFATDRQQPYVGHDPMDEDDEEGRQENGSRSR